MDGDYLAETGCSTAAAEGSVAAGAREYRLWGMRSRGWIEVVTASSPAPIVMTPVFRGVISPSTSIARTRSQSVTAPVESRASGPPAG
jgi:hypothetical protein